MVGGGVLRNCVGGAGGALEVTGNGGTHTSLPILGYLTEHYELASRCHQNSLMGQCRRSEFVCHHLTAVMWIGLWTDRRSAGGLVQQLAMNTGAGQHLC